MLRRTDPSHSTDEFLGKPDDLRLAWVTDPHFDHVKLEIWQSWAEQLLAYRPSALLLTGDLSEGDDVAYQLRCLAETFEIPIYFVLGNHDFYGKSIGQTRQDIIHLSREIESLHYLTDCGPIIPKKGFAIVGEDGWGDATQGDYEGSIVRLNDFALIEDFRKSDPSTWQSILQEQGRQSGERLRHKLTSVPDDTDHVLVATHVPPYREACWYEGKTTNDDWAPFFVCGGVGEVLKEVAASTPNRQYSVICGHTHHDGDAKVLPNLHVHTGYSRYGTLDIESLIDIGTKGFSVPRSGTIETNYPKSG